MGCNRAKLLALLIRLERDMPRRECKEVVRVYKERLEELAAEEVELDIFG